MIFVALVDPEQKHSCKAGWFGVAYQDAFLRAGEACSWVRHRDQQNTAVSVGWPFLSHSFLFTFHYGDNSKQSFTSLTGIRGFY